MAAAQEQYDNWDESDIDTFAGGGICHLIAEALVGVLDREGIPAQTVSSCFEQHVFVVCELAEGVYELDIPHSRYERGAGYCWTKVPNVVFNTDCLGWFCIDPDSDALSDYLD